MSFFFGGGGGFPFGGSRYVLCTLDRGDDGTDADPDPKLLDPVVAAISRRSKMKKSTMR